MCAMQTITNSSFTTSQMGALPTSLPLYRPDWSTSVQDVDSNSLEWMHKWKEDTEAFFAESVKERGMQSLEKHRPIIRKRKGSLGSETHNNLSRNKRQFSKRDFLSMLRKNRGEGSSEAITTLRHLVKSTTIEVTQSSTVASTPNPKAKPPTKKFDLEKLIYRIMMPIFAVLAMIFKCLCIHQYVSKWRLRNRLHRGQVENERNIPLATMVEGEMRCQMVNKDIFV